jgi:hypothetical protein
VPSCGACGPVDGSAAKRYKKVRVCSRANVHVGCSHKLTVVLFVSNRAATSTRSHAFSSITISTDCVCMYCIVEVVEGARYYCLLMWEEGDKFMYVHVNCIIQMYCIDVIVNDCALGNNYMYVCVCVSECMDSCLHACMHELCV